MQRMLSKHQCLSLQVSFLWQLVEVHAKCVAIGNCSPHCLPRNLHVFSQHFSLHMLIKFLVSQGHKFANVIVNPIIPMRNIKNRRLTVNSFWAPMSDTFMKLVSVSICKSRSFRVFCLQRCFKSTCLNLPTPKH